ncbi:MAG: hypothetical protein AUJ28_01190 [Parcubacteria group bacterium CG1_02_37_51]|uniref:Uncharacterized protein n=2 Tax=Candidatus Komeiliibacteriota TaxID=1817908 RepID=A0A2M8DQZ8_9BACT|nr:MAG: hypothetical protein AUJ28_01190 [Parcubacteria group bacterium CG1_02_37_51]PIY93913.1 MAG: hypothetical protein COY67_03490 [Candidatus Komeilibacteria bacterium CG_4_10_14_0_8_um_filter_37_78]PJC01810.1 MAG: hypothetical protein CO073_02780 [Candidatus Komeilibacteria bacterium CG_4_9_14_0_8_um_filter_36_9]
MFVDLWSIPHFLFGTLWAGFIIYLGWPFWMGLLVGIIVMIAWEFYEISVSVKEVIYNRTMDVVLGVFGYITMFYLLNILTRSVSIYIYIILLIIYIVITTTGYLSHKISGKNKLRK